ncbi:MAG: hypothetical protein IJY17_03385 [Alphaproteobacteria bacterium]|nr:hypothetical protein [Alphaproteobacteria bacterium]
MFELEKKAGKEPFSKKRYCGERIFSIYKKNEEYLNALLQRQSDIKEVHFFNDLRICAGQFRSRNPQAAKREDCFLCGQSRFERKRMA